MIAYFFSALLAVALVAFLILLLRAAQVAVENRLTRHVDGALSPDVCERCRHRGFHHPACFYALRDSA